MFLTRGSWDTQDLLRQALVLLGWVHPLLGVQDLVQLGQDDLTQVEKACGGWAVTLS